nr:serine hydrolase domain-containing protein [uncultured Mucilaginibacter sp.]
MKIFYKNSTLVLLTIILMGTHAFGQNNKALSINKYLNETFQSGSFNGNILVVDHGKLIVKAAFGYADAAKKTPLKTQYRFHIGSIAKEFDAVGLMMLKEQGRLNLDDKVAKFFPDLPAWAEKVSIKNLLQYTSGLPEVKWKTVHTDADNWKDLQSLQQLDFEPGSKYAYNNNNTFLRRRLIEKVTGMPFTQFVQQTLLKKAGISNGIVDPTDSEPLMAKSFNESFVQDGLAVPISGWTALNLDDFYKWSECIVNFRLIDPTSTRQILIPFAPDNQSGLGGGTMEGDKITTHVHDGTAMHYQALLTTNTGKGRTIIILTNQRNGNLYDIAKAVDAILDSKP